MRRFGLIFGVLLAGAVVFVFTSMAGLPAVVASHFDGRGVPNGFMPRQAYGLFMAVFTIGIPLFMVFAIGGLPRLFPNWVNIPNRAYWLAPERRGEAMDFLGRQAFQLGSMMLLFLCGVHWLVLRANARTPPRLAPGPIIIMTAAFFVFMAFWLITMLRRFKKIP